MESYAIDMRTSVFGHAFALAVLSVACVGTLRADTPTPAAEVAEFRLAPNLAWRYGAWVAKGPRIVSDSGEPLAAARVVELDRHGRNSVELPLDEDGRIVLNCYVNDGKRIKVSCEGYYSRQVTLSSECGETEIVLRRKRRPHPMLNHEVDVTLPMSAVSPDITIAPRIRHPCRRGVQVRRSRRTSFRTHPTFTVHERRVGRHAHERGRLCAPEERRHGLFKRGRRDGSDGEGL